MGIANRGTVYLDFSNHESWTWPSIGSRELRFKVSKNAAADADVYMDAAGVEVRYVQPAEVAVVLWEEL